MTDEEFERNCPDCDEPMHEVLLIDKTRGGHAELEYTLVDEKKSRWLGRYPVAGCVVSMMCPKCGRITLYGAEYEK